MQILVKGARRDWLVIATIIAFVCSAAALKSWFDLPSVTLTSYFANSFLIFAGVVFGALTWVCARLAIDRPDYPIRHFTVGPHGGSVLKAFLATLPLLSAMCLFMPHFGSVKSTIGLFQDYVWDSVWIEWDYVIHGDDSWKLLQPMLGFPMVTFGLNLAYQVWVLLLYIAFPMVCIWRGNRIVRQQMILAFFLCWIVIGAIMAHWLASVGPCFLEPLTGNTRFSDQMEYLKNVDRKYPLMVLDVQQRLLEAYLSDDHGLGRGISAMPSMHVSIATLFAIFSWHISRPMGILATGFLLVILLGSVHLAYHYAVDGYVSILVTILIWWIAGLIARRLHVDRFASQDESLTDELVGA